MTSSGPCLITYSILSSVTIVVLAILYHSCGSSTLENNQGNVAQRTEIGLINQSYDNEQCNCETNLPISILEGLVMVVLACTGIGLILKAMMHLRNWWKDKEESKRKRKESTEIKKGDD